MTHSNITSTEIKSVHFVELLQNAEVMEGSDVVFDCVINGSHPIGFQWYKDNEAIYHDDSKYSMVVNDKKLRLIVKDAKLEDTGNYRCAIGNDNSHVSSDAQLNVIPLKSMDTHEDYDFERSKEEQMSPKFIQPLKNCQVFANESVTLQVEIQGVPAPEVQWEFEGKPIVESDVLYAERDGNMLR